MADFVATQQRFVAAIREPASHLTLSQEERRRLAIYQALFFNNVESFLQSSFPVLHQVLTDTEWLALARAFFRDYRCDSPYFIHISRSFVEYLATKPLSLQGLPSFVPSLAHYEWLELDIGVRQTEHPPLLTMAQLAEEPVVLSSLAEVVSYDYPVHQIAADQIPQDSNDPEQYHFLVYRHQNNEVKFVVLASATAYFLRRLALSKEGVSLQEAALQSVMALPVAQRNAAAQGLSEIILMLVNERLLRLT